MNHRLAREADNRDDDSNNCLKNCYGRGLHGSRVDGSREPQPHYRSSESEKLTRSWRNIAITLIDADLANKRRKLVRTPVSVNCLCVTTRFDTSALLSSRRSECLSARLNFLNRHRGQHKQAEENKNQTSLPLLRPQAPQVDSYRADSSAEDAYD